MLIQKGMLPQAALNQLPVTQPETGLSLFMRISLSIFSAVITKMKGDLDGTY